jgi:hypothetical protein
MALNYNILNQFQPRQQVQPVSPLEVQRNALAIQQAQRTGVENEAARNALAAYYSGSDLQDVAQIDPLTAMEIQQGLPAAPKEHLFKQRLDPAQREAYEKSRYRDRSLIQIKRGRYTDLVDPLTGAVVETKEIEVAPGQKPEEKAEAARAVAEAKAKVAEAAAAPKKAEQQRQNLETARTVIKKTNQALDRIDWTSTGFFGKAMSIIPSSPGYNLDKTIDTLKANLGFDTLAKMRAASPTGGALGSVSERELNLLESALASLEIGQRDDILAGNLNEVKERYTKFTATLDPDFQSAVKGIDFYFGKHIDGKGFEVIDKGTNEVFGHYEVE